MTIAKWDKYHCLGMFLVSIVYIFTLSIPVLLFAAIISFGYLWFISWPSLKKPIPGGSYANWITAIRLLGLIAIGLFWNYFTNTQISIILGFLVILDGFDGYLARKFKQESTFGAYYDMETDALFVCIASLILLQKGIAGYWILIPAFMRYIYVALIYLLALNEQNDKRTTLGPVIAVVMFIALCISFVLPQNTATSVLEISSFLLLLSFGYSFLQLFKRKYHGV
jgi:phosphatidylglycerophosphate synthase